MLVCKVRGDQKKKEKKEKKEKKDSGGRAPSSGFSDWPAQ
jgi:hypothetical protein